MLTKKQNKESFPISKAKKILIVISTEISRNRLREIKILIMNVFVMKDSEETIVTSVITFIK